MISRYNALLNGVAMSAIDEDLYVADIRYPAPQVETNYATLAKRHGSMVVSSYVRKRTVVIPFELHIYSTQQRQAVCQRVCEWARNGGYLETSDRPGQRLRVVCEKYPTITSAMKWTDELSLTFASDVLPHWEEVYPATAETDGNGEAALYLPGNAEERALVDAVITLTGAADEITVQAGETAMTLSGLDGQENDVITIDHDENLFLQIKLNGASILDKRTGADELTAGNGETTLCSVTGPATAVFSARGLWQ